MRKTFVLLMMTLTILVGWSSAAHAAAGISAGKCESGGGSVGGDGGGGLVCVNGKFDGYRVI